MNVLHFQYAAGASTPGTTEIAALDALLVRLYFGAALGTGTQWFANCPSSTTLEQIDYVILDGSSLGSTIPHAQVGVTGSPLPPEVSPVLTLLTGKRGRRYRGRIYLPTPNLTAADSAGQIATGVRTSIQNQFLGLMTQLASIQWAPVVASYGHGQTTDKVTKVVTKTTWPPFATPITAVRMDQFFDVQRSRKTG